VLKVTALGSNTQSAAGAASGVADYLLGKADDTERATAQLLSPVAGTEQQGRYYADSIEGPGQWLGHGAARLELHGVVNREAFERVLSGRDPATGARLLSARGSAGRTSLKVGNHTRTGLDGQVLYGIEDAASALGLRPEDVEQLIATGRESSDSDNAGNDVLHAVEVDGEPFVTDAELVRWETANRALATADNLRSDGRASDLLSMNEAASRIGVTPQYLRRIADRTLNNRAEIDAALAEGRVPEQDWLDTVTITEAAPVPPAFEPPFALDGPPFTASEAAAHVGLAQPKSIYRILLSGELPAERQPVERPGKGPGHRWVISRADLASYLTERHDKTHRAPPSTSKRRFVTREALAQFLDRREPPAVRVGFDLTFTVQKSVSVLGLLTDGDHQDTVVEAFDAANAVAIDWLEHNAAFTRRNGKRVPTEGLVVGSFLHGTSRALDPFLHRHNIVANAAIDRNGDHKALDSTALWRQSHPADALATAELRYRLSAELGVQWVRSPRGTWEIDGINEAVIMEFSTRRREILEALNEVNDGTTADAHGRDMAAVRTRGEKQPSTRDELVAGWRDRAAAHGLDARALDRCTGHKVTLHDQLDRRQQAKLREWLEGEHGVTAEHSTFSRRDVIIAIADYPGPDGKGLLMPAAEIVRQTDEWLASVQVASIEADGTARTSDRISRRDGRTVRTTAHEPVFTTVSALRRQEKLLALFHAAPDGRGKVSQAKVTAAIGANQELSDEQAAMVQAFTRSGRPVQAGVGLAGAGKTFTMRVAAKAWTDDGFKVMGTTLAGQAAQVLAAEAGIDAETVAMLLAKWRASGDNPLDARTVLIVDEAATIDDRSFLALLTMADEAGAAVRCIGDPGQHQAVAAGGAFRVMAEDPSSPTLLTSRRVVHDGDRHAAELLRAGRPSEALTVLADHGHLFETSDENDAYRLALAMWWQNRADGAAAPLVERTNKVREELNRGARRLRQNAGEVAVDREVTAAGGRAFSVGDEVVARVGDRTLHGDRPEDYVANGTTGEVVAVDPEADTITVDFGERGTHQLDREYFDARPRQPDGKTIAGLDLRYAITSHGVQGATFDRIVSILRSGATMAEAYVNITRGRHANEVITVAPSPDADTEAFLPTIEDRRTGRDAVAASLARDEPDEMALSIDPLASAVALLRSTRSIPDLQHDLDRAGDDAPAELRRAVADLTAAAARAVVADPDPELVAAFGPRPDVPWMRDQWEAAIRDIAGFRAARPQPAGDGPWAWALGTPPATEPASEHRRTVIEALGDTVTTLTLRRLADRTIRPDTAEATPLHQMTATSEVPTPQVTPADVTAATRAAAHTAQRVRDARQHLETVQDRRAPGLRRNRSQLADAREALQQAEAAHQAARTHREQTKARELEARLDARRHTQGLPSGPQAQARAETVRHQALTDPPPWLRAAITAAAAAGAGTVLASEDFTRWAGDVAVYRDLRNIDPADEHPIGHRPPDGPLATEHDRLRRHAPIPTKAAAAEPVHAQVPA
jgi:conjugative relaxase-like TrwC/TraI family protein